MRLFALLLLASLPATVKAVPFAEYNPASGDIVFSDVLGNRSLNLTSQASRLHPDIASLPFEISPGDVTPPLTAAVGRSASWYLRSPEQFAFNVLKVRGAIQPGTSLADLKLVYDPQVVGENRAPILIVPEPSVLALASFSLVGLSLIWRRGLRINTMRPAFAILLLASLPATASAAPYAEYNPASGDIVFREVYDGIQIWLESATDRLNTPTASLPFELAPAGATPPRVRGDEDTAFWDFPPNKPFEFHTLTVRGAIRPFTPVSDLSFLFHPRQSTAARIAPIFAIPEPSSLAVAGSSLLGLSFIRRLR